jgi:hypothetical protein
MKLITFQLPDGAPRSGMLIDADQRLVDLQAASQARWGEESPLLASVLTIIEGGSNALDRVRETVRGVADAAPSAILDRSKIKLLAPVPTRLRCEILFASRNTFSGLQGWADVARAAVAGSRGRYARS